MDEVDVGVAGGARNQGEFLQGAVHVGRRGPGEEGGVGPDVGDCEQGVAGGLAGQGSEYHVGAAGRAVRVDRLHAVGVGRVGLQARVVVAEYWNRTVKIDYLNTEVNYTIATCRCSGILEPNRKNRLFKYRGKLHNSNVSL